jgi:uncharacterized membrane-anchored protein
MIADAQQSVAKVPAITLGFWLLKILATTLGETGGDALSMSMNLGYLLSTGIFAVVFIAFVWAQVRAETFHPVLYWATIIATTTVGTTLADYATRSLGIGYPGGSLLLLVLLGLSLWVWYRDTGSLDVSSVASDKAERYYWTTIMFSQTLGTALGDWTADTAGLGYAGGIAVFAILLAAIAIAWFTTRVSRTLLFWAAFVLTRPLGAVVGDLLDKPVDHGGLALSRYTASLVLLGLIALGVWLLRSAPPPAPTRRQTPALDPDQRSRPAAPIGYGS